MEGTNIRELSFLPELADGAVMDLSFISITKVLSQVNDLLQASGFLIALVKPQFEAGIERLPKDGVIKDEKIRQQILHEVQQFAIEHGWTHHQTIDSPIVGKSGNKEFLSYFSKNPSE
jgi:23S rRNA (cytidine1920-2'-O)/16S rRNA (cytidine1409-2'-O)-methyltransferase